MTMQAPASAVLPSSCSSALLRADCSRRLEAAFRLYYMTPRCCKCSDHNVLRVKNVRHPRQYVSEQSHTWEASQELMAGPRYTA